MVPLNESARRVLRSTLFVLSPSHLPSTVVAAHLELQCLSLAQPGERPEMEDEGYLSGLLASLDSAATPEKRIAALQSIQSYVSEVEEIQETDQLTAALKMQLKNQNHLVSSLALSIIPVYASKLVSRQHHSKVQDVKALILGVLSIVLEKLGDHKEKIREGARAAIIELASAAFVVSPSGSNLAKDVHSAPALFEKIYKESGLLAKSAKVKEQVRRLASGGMTWADILLCSSRRSLLCH
jgi:hypothetical protein